MASVLETIEFEPVKFQRELHAFDMLLKSRAELSEMKDIQPFFKESKHLTAYLGTFALNIGVATEICFEYEFFGDFKADILLGSKQEKEFCVVEFEDGKHDTIFKKQPKRKNPEWSARFEHAFSQIVDWFYNLEDFKNTQGFSATFGPGHTSFTGLLVMGRSANLDEIRKSRLKWRTDTVSIGKHKVICITYDELHAGLRRKFNLYSAGSRIEATNEEPSLPPPPFDP
jgi:Shedu protein SduA, C-terminal